MHTNKRKAGLRALSGFILASGTVLAGCSTDKLVTVTDPTYLSPGSIDNAASVPGLIQGALVQLQGGYSGFGDDAFVASSALISDEFYWGDTFTTRQAVDMRILQPTALGNVPDPAFARLQQARFNARRAYAAIGKFPGSTSNDLSNQSLMRTYEGYTYVTISEGWCNSVPFSILPDSGAIDPAQLVGGVGINTKQMNDTAITRFNQALAITTASAANLNLARVGAGRALLNEGRFAEAAVAVSAVPDKYVFLFQHSTNSGSENNPVAALIQNGRYGVGNLEGAVNASGTAARPDTGSTAVTASSAEGLPFRGAKDPRIPYEAKPNCFTSSIRCWYNDNYPSLASQLPLASGVEARLIEAEAALQAGDAATMMSKLNALRAAAATLLPVLSPQQKQVFSTTLAALADPADPLTTTAAQFASRRDLLFRERAFWLYNTGHRQGDLRRLARDYGLATSAVFPSGPYFRGGTYGADVSFPVPFNEANNANYVATGCDTTKP
jgi:hypothetical protein